jgi:hypothetical protein
MCAVCGQSAKIEIAASPIEQGGSLLAFENDRPNASM